jgi:membrane-bound lytic murein transglycosylase B
MPVAPGRWLWQTARMHRRRILTLLSAAGAASLVGVSRADAAGAFQDYLVSVDRQAMSAGISYATRRATLYGLQPNEKCIELINRQPEFTQTWAQYAAARLSSTRIANGRQNYAAASGLLNAIRARFGVDPGVIMGIWGLETNYGQNTGGFSVVQALATLGWASHRGPYFRSELIAALRILDRGAISPQGMTGSYAGAMGQPQFMPSVYLKLAVDYGGQGRPNIWTSTPDSLASIANYLKKSGWHAGEPWGEQVILGPNIQPAGIDPDQAQPLRSWLSMGVRRLPHARAVYATIPARLILPDGVGGDSYLVYPNFKVIRRYNPSDFYALSVGLLGDIVT